VLLDPGLPMRRARAGPAVAWQLPQRGQSRTLYTFNGTAAVYQAVKAVGVSPTQTVLVPAYNCGHEVEAVLRSGARVAFYRVGADMQIDVQHLAAAVDGSTRAVLVTHYFGFPQPLGAIRELCDRQGLALIEDCAHALFSASGAEPLGTIGDLAAYSLRKTLPLPHGGALVCHAPELPVPRSLRAPPGLSTLPKLLERYQKGRLLPAARWPTTRDKAMFVAGRLAVEAAKGVRALAAAVGRTQLDPDDESFAFPGETLDWGMDAAAVEALREVEPGEIVAARRRNYELLLAAAGSFADCRSALPVLPDGVCPLYFPAFAERPREIVRRLARGAVASVQWWGTFHRAVPWRQFPEAEWLKRNVVALPVHQDLGVAHMRRVAELLVER